PSAFWAVIAIAPALFFGCLTSAYRGYYQGFSNMVPTAISQIIEASVKLILGLSLSFIVLKIGMTEFNMYGTVFGKIVADAQSAQLAVMPFAAAAAIVGIMISTLCGTIYLLFRHKIKGDTIPYYFVLNNDNVNLSIKKNGYILQGNAENRDYFAYRCKRQEIIKTKKALWAKYKKLVSDSLLSDSIELQLKGKNDELIDSLHRMTNRYIDSNTTASELVLRKFGR
ncbi:MAG: hypothetical protein RR938_07880, partial [Muribaculaceae bacterium]